MTFLKQHWRFAVPTAVVLCVLILGAVALYSTSEPLEPSRVYAMPERSETPPSLNTGGLLPVGTVPSDEITVATESSDTQIASAAESPESCCPEVDTFEATHDSNRSYTRAALPDDSDVPPVWQIEIQEHVAKQEVLHEEATALGQEATALLQTLFAALSPEDRSSIINHAVAELSRENLDEDTLAIARQHLSDMLTSTTGVVPSSRQQLQSDAASLIARAKSLEEKIAHKSPDEPF